MAWPCPHWPQTVFFGGDAGEEQCSWGPPDSRARSPTGRSQGSGKRHGDVEEYPSADRDRFFIGKKAPFLHYFLGPSDVRWQTLPTLKREDPFDEVKDILCWSGMENPNVGGSFTCVWGIENRNYPFDVTTLK